MTRTVLLAAAAIAALLPLTAVADSPKVVASPAALVWTAGPATLPKGAQIAILFGDPSKAGPYAYRIKFPAGFKISPHMHPNDENVTVLSGTANIGFGDKLDQSKTTAVVAGGFFHIPKGTRHYAWFSQQTVIQGNGVGPSGISGPG